MKRITFKQNNCKEETTSTWLIAVMKFGLKIEFFKPFKYFELKMKKVKYSVYQKMMTIIMSIVMGCEFMKDINEKLGTEKLSANLFNMDSFPDQSQINILLRRMDSTNISQLEDIHSELFKEHSSSANSQEQIVVDFDQSGYQLSAAFAGKNAETVGMYLDSGNVHCSHRFRDLLNSSLEKYSEQLKISKLIIRADSGYGTEEIIDMVSSVSKLKFVIKGYSSKTAKNIAKTIDISDYTQVDRTARVYEIPNTVRNRIIIVQILTKQGRFKYSHLITNIPKKEMNAVELFKYYNQRQTIEAFFKMAKNVYHIRNLRTTKFHGIYAFLWIVFITHNLIVLFKETLLKDTPLKNVGIGDLVKKVGNVKGFVRRTLNEIIVDIPTITKLANLIANAMCNPSYEQLSFNL